MNLGRLSSAALMLSGETSVGDTPDAEIVIMVAEEGDEGFELPHAFAVHAEAVTTSSRTNR